MSPEQTKSLVESVTKNNPSARAVDTIERVLAGYLSQTHASTLAFNVFTALRREGLINEDAPDASPETTREAQAMALFRHIQMTPGEGCVADGGDHWQIVVFGKWGRTSKPTTWEGQPIQWIEGASL